MFIDKIIFFQCNHHMKYEKRMRINVCSRSFQNKCHGGRIMTNEMKEWEVL